MLLSSDSGNLPNLFPATTSWLALMIGNSRLHWAVFAGDQLLATWDTPHLSSFAEGIASIASRVDLSFATPELWIASVVPSQTCLWQDYGPVHFISLEQVPLRDVYPTLGVDRALALWGAISTTRSPVLVIDAGTALTFTGANRHHQLIGGAILPGLRLQFQALRQGTTTLPELTIPQTPILPDRWARNTESAIASGIIHTLLAGIQCFIEDWWKQFPDSDILLTGGDSTFLYQCLTAHWHHSSSREVTDPWARILLNPNIIFAGIHAIRNREGAE